MGVQGDASPQGDGRACDRRRLGRTSEIPTAPALDVKNPLLVAVLVAAAISIVAGVTADSRAEPTWALLDNRLYKAEIALATFLALYALTTVFWLAAHRMTFKSLSAGPVGAELPQASEEIEGSAELVEQLGRQIDTISQSTATELEHYDARLRRIESSVLGRLLPGDPPTPPDTASSSAGQ